MAIVKIQANWCMQWQKQFNLPPGYMVLKINPDYLNKAQGEFKNLARKQKEKDQLLNIDLSIDIHLFTIFPICFLPFLVLNNLPS